MFLPKPTEEEIRAQIDLLASIANAEEDSFDRECARNLCSVLQWVLGTGFILPIDLTGYVTMRIVKHDAGPLEIITREPEERN